MVQGTVYEYCNLSMMLAFSKKLVFEWITIVDELSAYCLKLCFAYFVTVSPSLALFLKLYAVSTFFSTALLIYRRLMHKLFSYNVFSCVICIHFLFYSHFVWIVGHSR